MFLYRVEGQHKQVFNAQPSAYQHQPSVALRSLFSILKSFATSVDRDQHTHMRSFIGLYTVRQLDQDDFKTFLKKFPFGSNVFK